MIKLKFGRTIPLNSEVLELTTDEAYKHLTIRNTYSLYELVDVSKLHKAYYEFDMYFNSASVFSKAYDLFKEEVVPFVAALISEKRTTETYIADASGATNLGRCKYKISFHFRCPNDLIDHRANYNVGAMLDPIIQGEFMEELNDLTMEFTDSERSLFDKALVATNGSFNPTFYLNKNFNEIGINSKSEEDIINHFNSRGHNSGSMYSVINFINTNIYKMNRAYSIGYFHPDNLPAVRLVGSSKAGERELKPFKDTSFDINNYLVTNVV